MAGFGRKGSATTLAVPVGGLGTLSSSFQTKEMAPGKFKMKADTMN